MWHPNSIYGNLKLCYAIHCMYKETLLTSGKLKKYSSRDLRSAVLSGPPSIKCVISSWEKGQICLSRSKSGWTWDLGANSWISFGRFHIWMKFLTDVIKFGFRQKSFIINAPLVSWAYWSSLLCGCNSKIVFLEKFTAQLLDLLNWTNFFSSFQNTFKIWMRVLVV